MLHVTTSMFDFCRKMIAIRQLWESQIIQRCIRVLSRVTWLPCHCLCSLWALKNKDGLKLPMIPIGLAFKPCRIPSHWVWDRPSDSFLINKLGWNQWNVTADIRMQNDWFALEKSSCHIVNSHKERPTWQGIIASENWRPGNRKSSLEVNPSVVKRWDDYSPGWHLGCSLMKNLKLEAPS